MYKAKSKNRVGNSAKNSGRDQEGVIKLAAAILVGSKIPTRAEVKFLAAEVLSKHNRKGVPANHFVFDPGA